MAKLPPEFRDLAVLAKDQGWTLDFGRAHPRFVSPNGVMVVAPSTPSDWRSGRNLKADLRRAGLDLTGPQQVTKPTNGHTGDTVDPFVVFAKPPSDLDEHIRAVLRKGSMPEGLLHYAVRDRVKVTRDLFDKQLKSMLQDRSVEIRNGEVHLKRKKTTRTKSKQLVLTRSSNSSKIATIRGVTHALSDPGRTLCGYKTTGASHDGVPNCSQCLELVG